VRERRVEGTSCLSLRRSPEARGFKKVAPGFANLSSEAQKFGHPVVGLRIPNQIAHGGISLIVPPALPALLHPLFAGGPRCGGAVVGDQSAGRELN
jgi:hypothetical protein